MIATNRIGHLVIKVRSLDRSLEFYVGTLGLKLMNRSDMGGVNVAFLSSGGRDHHELGLVEVGPDAEAPDPRSIGLVHFAFRMDSDEQLASAYQELKAANVPISFTVNHGVADGVYFLDHDTATTEIYTDNPLSEVEQFENPYAGGEKLDFALDDNSIADALAALRGSVDPAGARM